MDKEYEQSNEYDLGTQLKTWYSLNPSFGCIWDCAYCIQHKDEFFDKADYKKVNKVFSWQETVEEIMSNPRITSKTPLTFYNFSDPFLPHNTSDLRSILTELDNRDFHNIVGLISRTYADKQTLDTIADLKNLKPVVLVTYAGYTNRDVEKAPPQKRILLMKELSERNIPTLLYLRPLVQEWMEEGQIEKVYEETKDHIDGVVMSGIRMTPEILAKVESKGLPKPYTKNFENKFFPEGLQEQVVKTFVDIPVFRYTSCGVSAVLGVPDFNAHAGFFHYANKGTGGGCDLPCKEGQSKICQCAVDNIDQSILPETKRLLSKIGKEDVGYRLQDKAIILDTKLPKTDLTFLRHNLGAHVDSEDNDHHIDSIYKKKEEEERT